MAYDGRVHHLDMGYWLKFEIGRVEPTPERPWGLRYAFALHDPEGDRLIEFDNDAHATPPRGSRVRRAGHEGDHWHRSGSDPGRLYTFTTADQLLADFFTEVRRALHDAELGLQR
ncbi:MAG TPA: DUF6516 family protein [Xanthobacteraceae bacterium]|nr:DUF6516 family protein [Xanthobacteraceae bacterium]